MGDMLHYFATEAAKGVKVQPHHIEGRVFQNFGLDMTDQLATIEARSLYPIEEPIIEPLIELCKGTKAEPESVEKFITDLRLCKAVADEQDCLAQGCRDACESS